MPNETKGITVKIDAALHAEVKKYLEENGMTMAEFVTRAIDNELNPKIKEENKVEKMRTLAFQVPESFFQRIKDHLSRTGMSQKDFVLGLIEEELDRAEEMSAAEQTDTEGPAPEEDAEETVSEEYVAPADVADADGDEKESETEEYPESEDVYGEEAEGDSPEEDSADYGEVYMEDLGDPDTADDWYGEDADEDDTEEIGEYDEDDPEDDEDFDGEEDPDEYGEDEESEENEEEDSLSFVRLM